MMPRGHYHFVSPFFFEAFEIDWHSAHCDGVIDPCMMVSPAPGNVQVLEVEPSEAAAFRKLTVWDGVARHECFIWVGVQAPGHLIPPFSMLTFEKYWHFEEIVDGFPDKLRLIVDYKICWDPGKYKDILFPKIQHLILFV